MRLFPVSDHNHIRSDSPVGGKRHWIVARTFAGLDLFGEGALAILHFDIGVDITSLQVLDNKSNGGEGGIRTPGTLSGTPVFKTGAINHSATSPDTAERDVTWPLQFSLQQA
jgi:hypothetical protein